jgi:hypothetical protein
MDLLRGAVVGAALGVGAALLCRRTATEPVSLGVPAPHLEGFPALARKVVEFRALARTSTSAQRQYETLVAAADEFARHAAAFSRTAQFRCNRLIGIMQESALGLASEARTPEADHLRDHVWPEAARLCDDTLHNLILDL